MSLRDRRPPCPVATIVTAAVTAIVLSYASTGIYLYQQAQVARRDQALAQALAQDRGKTIEHLGGDFREQVPHMVLGWFLFEWSQNRLDRARQIRAQVAPDLPLHAAMGFLLDEGYAADKLLAALPRNRSLAHYVIGERHLRAGRTDAALRAFALSISERGDDWVKAAARDRVEMLGTPSAPAAVAPGTDGLK